MKVKIHGHVEALSFDVQARTRFDPQKRSEILVGPAARCREGEVKENVFPFGLMFEGLVADPANLLPDAPDTAANLVALAGTMVDPTPTPANAADASRDSTIPAAYTYLGQFIDHDVTKTETVNEAVGSNMEAAFHAAMAGRNVSPMPQENRAAVVNRRVPALNLDSVLSSAAPRTRGVLDIGRVTTENAGDRPELPFEDPADLFLLHDLPRNPPINSNEELDRRALIGDPRNDENLAVQQLHVAFLRAHHQLRKVVRLTEVEADLHLQHLFQRIVIDDFLPTICDPGVVAAMASHSCAFYRPTHAHPYMPLEFSVAAFRFGHSMVRDGYNYNSVFENATLGQMFSFTAFAGDIGLPQFGVGPFPTLPHNWIIDWARWLPHAGATLNHAKKIDTLIADHLQKLPQHSGVIGGTGVNILAVRNLVRGLMLGLPTGQAVAGEVARIYNALPGIAAPITPLEAGDLLAVARGASQAQADALQAGAFDTRTPLWYYMLAEAAHGGGSRLGPVCSVIVASTLIELIKLARDNVLACGEFDPKIPTEDYAKVKLVDLLRFAKVFPSR